MSKIKGADKVHPYSRKAEQVRRAYAREERMQNVKSAKTIERELAVNRLVWFKHAIPYDDIEKEGLDLEDILHDLVDMYINRNDDEMDQLLKNARPGRPKAVRLIHLEMLKGKDKHEYATGMS